MKTKKINCDNVSFQKAIWLKDLPFSIDNYICWLADEGGIFPIKAENIPYQFNLMQDDLMQIEENRTILPQVAKEINLLYNFINNFQVDVIIN